MVKGESHSARSIFTAEALSYDGSRSRSLYDRSYLETVEAVSSEDPQPVRANISVRQNKMLIYNDLRMLKDLLPVFGNASTYYFKIAVPTSYLIEHLFLLRSIFEFDLVEELIKTAHVGCSYLYEFAG